MYNQYLVNEPLLSMTAAQFLTILDTNFRPFFLKLHPQILRVSGISFHNFHS